MPEIAVMLIKDFYSIDIEEVYDGTYMGHYEACNVVFCIPVI